MELRRKLTLWVAGVLVVVMIVVVGFQLYAISAGSGLGSRLTGESPSAAGAAWDRIRTSNTANTSQDRPKGSHGRIIILSVAGFTALLAATAAATFLRAGKFSRPIAELRRASDEMAAGNLDVRIIARDGGGEIGELERSMRRAARELSSMMARVGASAEGMGAAGAALSVRAARSARVTDEIAASASGMALDADAQSKATRALVETLCGMSAGLGDVGSISSLMLVKSGETLSAAEAGSRSLAEAIKRMDDMSMATRQTAAELRGLGEKSRDVGEIAALIKVIAERTNVLALNAAIEAARAGAAGRGFAVVADEVRKLAEQSREITGRITSEISQIQASAEKAVKLMEAGMAVAAGSDDAIARIGEAFGKIIAKIESLDDDVTRITSTARELSATEGTLRLSADNLSGVSERTAKAALYMASAARAQSSDMREIARSSGDIASMGSDMRRHMSGFRMSDANDEYEQKRLPAGRDEIIKQLQAASMSS
jgi:methyl-accepting chemotaxis protein